MVHSSCIFFLLYFVLNSAKTRQAALEGIKNALASKMLYEFILERRMTLTDSIERCLKKGNVLTLHSHRTQEEFATFCAVTFVNSTKSLAHSSTGVQPWWIQGNSKRGRRQRLRN